MTDRFWKLIASRAVLGLFYVGHGLHQQHSVDSFPTFSKSALADGIAIEQGKIYTTSPDGSQVHCWSMYVGRNGVQYINSASVPGQAPAEVK
ncbi:hypothetical protein SH668x_000265 [Planctomicrobium sp. SH668]|uniref:hypothetical protein n=1 Tax=Planctomicrobium sp. SH668 TaxID=3448126 RepID=UPI003F5B8379